MPGSPFGKKKKKNTLAHTSFSSFVIIIISGRNNRGFSEQIIVINTPPLCSRAGPYLPGLALSAKCGYGISITMVYRMDYVCSTAVNGFLAVTRGKIV